MISAKPQYTFSSLTSLRCGWGLDWVKVGRC